jgi:hypothetical protein
VWAVNNENNRSGRSSSSSSYGLFIPNFIATKYFILLPQNFVFFSISVVVKAIVYLDALK